MDKSDSDIRVSDAKIAFRGYLDAELCAAGHERCTDAEAEQAWQGSLISDQVAWITAQRQVTALAAERDAAYAALRQAARTIPTAWSWHESHAAAISRATQAVPKG
jgi:hypothetical protein